MIFECVGAQIDQFIHGTLDLENAFELFIRMMSDLRCLAFFATLARHVRASVGAHKANFAA